MRYLSSQFFSRSSVVGDAFLFFARMVEIKDPKSIMSQSINNLWLVIPAVVIILLIGKAKRRFPWCCRSFWHRSSSRLRLSAIANAEKACEGRKEANEAGTKGQEEEIMDVLNTVLRLFLTRF